MDPKPIYIRKRLVAYKNADVDDPLFTERRFPDTVAAKEFLDKYKVTPKTIIDPYTVRVNGHEFFSNFKISDILAGRPLRAIEPPPMPAAKMTNPELSKKQKRRLGRVVVLKELCRRLDMNPRTARIKLRRLFPGNEKQRWEWTPEEAKKIEYAVP